MSDFKPIDFSAGAAKLQEIFKARFPEEGAYDFSDPEKSDRELVRLGRLTDAQLAEIYSQAYAVEQLIEEEIMLPELPENSPAEFFNTHCCLPIEWADEYVTMLVCDPYYLDTIGYLAEKTWNCKVAPRFVRRPFLERMLSKLQNLDQEEESREQEDENTLGDGSVLVAEFVAVADIGAFEQIVDVIFLVQIDLVVGGLLAQLGSLTDIPEGRKDSCHP